MERDYLRLLLIIEDTKDLLSLKSMLASIYDGKVMLEWADSSDTALSVIKAKRHDVFLIDARIDENYGLELMNQAVNDGCTAPIILISSENQREINLAAMQAGAADCLIREELTASLVDRSIRYALERQKTADALRKGEERLARAQRIAHLGNWEWDIPDNGMCWSDEVFRIFGLYPQQFQPSYEALLMRVHPEDRPLVNRAVNEAIYDQKPYSVEHRVVLPVGGERVVQQQGEVTYDESGMPLTMTGTVQDITARRRAEDGLRLMEEKFSKAFHASPDWIVMSRAADGKYIEVNEAFLKITGYSREEVIGRTSVELGIWTDGQERLRMLKMMEQRGVVRDLEIKCRIKSGETRLMLWSAEVIEYNGEGCLIALAHDITEQRKLENDLIQSQAKLYKQHEELTRLFTQVEASKREWETTMDHVGDLVILADRDGKIKKCNRAFQMFVDLPYDSIIGVDWIELLNEYDLMSGTIYLQSMELYHASSGKWFILNPYPFQDSELEEIAGTVITIHDNTEIKQFAEQLAEMNQELKQREAELKATRREGTADNVLLTSL